MKNLDQGNQNRERRKNLKLILDSEYINSLFQDKKAYYFPQLKKEKILEIQIKQQSQEWMKDSCMARYKISFSSGKCVFIRATAYYDGSKKDTFKTMNVIYKSIPNETFQIPRALDYREEASALFYQEASGKPFSSLIEKAQCSLKMFSNVGKGLSHFHSLKSIKNSSITIGKKEYLRTFSRIKKILPSLRNDIIPTKKIPFLNRLDGEVRSIHGDLYTGNIIIDKNNIYFIDLDKAGRGSLFLDLSLLYFSLNLPSSIWKTGLKKLDIKRYQEAFLSSYCKESSLDLEKTRVELENFRSKTALDSLDFVVGIAYRGWSTIDDKSKKMFEKKIKDLLVFIDRSCK